MTKIVEFENLIDDAITETFETLKQLKEAIKYFGNTTIASLLEAHLDTYKEMEQAEK